MKKILFYVLVVLLGVGLFNSPSFAECTYNFDSNANIDISAAIDGCLGESGLVEGGSGGTILNADGVKSKVEDWIGAVGQFLAFGAIFAIVFGGLMLTLANGEDEKIKKGKDIIKWGILGFVAVIMAGSAIALVVNIIYGLS